MVRKVIIDCDPGIDDALALCAALFDPALEVMAITATAGTIPAERATANLRALVEWLDPPRHPRIGIASPTENAPVLDDSRLHGSDGLANLDLPVSLRQHEHSAEKVISEMIRLHPGNLTVICLGPLSNLAQVLTRDPNLAEDIDRIIIGGGSLNHPGNVLPRVEFNMYFNPDAARTVFHSATTKSLVPLDVSTAVSFSLDVMDKLPLKSTRAGDLCHRLLQFYFRQLRQVMGCETIPLSAPVVVRAAIEPELFSWEEMAGDVEPMGELTRGATVFDQRSPREWSINMDVATGCNDPEAIHQQILRSLKYAGQAT